MKPKPRIYNNRYIRVSLANNSITTLNEYILAPVNVYGMMWMLKNFANINMADIDMHTGGLRNFSISKCLKSGAIQSKDSEFNIVNQQSSLMYTNPKIQKISRNKT